ncbi:uncharacterized protein LOC134233104 [Saccostrea cucullata]|uniref:uncharacterized protein LOC134233104 n=1 Tax=Saccostrea cuccullata TaxID=36930 RepID=UPI002ED10BA4
MKRYCYNIVLVAFLVNFLQDIESVLYSLPDTAKIVKSCPKSKTDWMKRSAIKNCSSSTHSNISYHCVLNEWGNASVEVCAASRVILYGKCAEYNFGAKRIQSSSIQRCSSSNPPCPDAYNSSQAYMYQTCYHGFASNISHNASKAESHSSSSRLSETDVAVITTSIIILAITISTTACIVLKRKLCISFNRQLDECQTPCMDNNKDTHSNKQLIK